MRILRLNKEALRTAVASLPEGKEIRMRLGLDADCDYTRRSGTYYPYRCRKADLLALLDTQPEERLRPMRGNPGYLVLKRLHAFCLCDIFGTHTELAAGHIKLSNEQQAV